MRIKTGITRYKLEIRRKKSLIFLWKFCNCNFFLLRIAWEVTPPPPLVLTSFSRNQRYDSIWLTLITALCSLLTGARSAQDVWWGLWLPHQVPRARGLWGGKDQLSVSVHRRQIQLQIHHHGGNRLQRETSGECF